MSSSDSTGAEPGLQLLAMAIGTPASVERGVFEMIGRQRAEPCRETRPAEVGELIGMQFHLEAERRGGGEDTRGLVGGEGNRLAKGIDRVGQTRPRDGRQHLRADEIDIVALSSGVFRRQRMGAEETH